MLRIADLLPGKQAEAVSYQQLSELTGLTIRQLREAVRRERRQGAVILSSKENGCSGLWLWDGSNLEEMERCYQSMVSAGADILQTAAIMKDSALAESGVG